MGFRRLGARSGVSLSLDGLERAAELLEYGIKGTDGDQSLTASIPDTDWALTGRAYQSVQSGSLWRYARDHSGQTVGFTIRPTGSATPTPNAPHYRGSVVIGAKPDLGGASKDPVFIFEFEWHIVGEPEEVTA